MTTTESTINTTESITTSGTRDLSDEARPTSETPPPKSRWSRPVALALLTLTLGVGCGQQDDDSAAKLIEGVAKIDTTATPGTVDAGAATSTTSTTSDGTVMNCTDQPVSLTDEPSEFAVLDPNSDVLWPGSLIQGKDIASGVFSPVPVPRAPGTISLTIENGNPQPVSQLLPHPSLSEAVDAQNAILSRYSGGTPASLSYLSEAVSSVSQIEVEAGVNAGGVAWSAAANLNFDQASGKNHYLVKMTQKYFTMAFDPPEGAAAMLDPSVTAADLAPYTGPGNPLVYIASVSYGRVFYLLFESSDSATNLAAMVSAAFGDKDKFTGSTQISETASKTTVTSYAIGGDAQDALSGIVDMGSLNTFLVGGADFSPQNPGVPISYTIRYLKDATEVRLALTTSYTAQECTPATSGTSDNLIANPGLEQANQTWNFSGVVADKYGDSNGQKNSVDGTYYFGAPIDSGCSKDITNAYADEVIDLSPWADQIDSGKVTYQLSGYLGGWEDQNDDASVTVYFYKDATNVPPGQWSSSDPGTMGAQIGPVTPQDRGNVTEMLFRSSPLTAMPAGFHAVKIQIQLWSDYGCNDGAADALSFVLNGPNVSAPPAS
jgi:Thiol-activated cytolysin